MTTLTIKNEEQFINFITKLSQNESDNFEFPDIVFDGFPKLNFNVKGEHYNSTLTTFLLNGLSLLTTEIQKSYCVLRYNTSNLQRLTVEDKELIDIIFTIKEGSSEGESDNSNIVNAVLDFIINGMTGMNSWHKLTVLIMLIGALGWNVNTWLGNQDKSDEREYKAQTAQTELVSDAIKALEKIYQKGENPKANEIKQHIEQGDAAFFKEVAKDKDVKSAMINHTTLNRDELDEYKKRSSKSKIKTPKIDKFIIKGISLYAPQYIETDIDIAVIRDSDEAEFTLRTSLELMSDDEFAKLKLALGTNELVRISYEEIKENGKLIKSQFVRIDETNSELRSPSIKK